MSRILTTTLSLVFLCTAPLPVLGQTESYQGSTPAPDEITEDELVSAANLYVEIEEIQAVYETKLMRTQNAEEKSRLEKEREDEVDAVIEEAPLSEERYEAILQTADEDAEFEKEFLSRVQDVRSEE